MLAQSYRWPWVHIRYFSASPAHNHVWDNNIGTDAGGNDSSYWLLNSKNGVYLDGVDNQHKVGATDIQGANIVFAKGQRGIAISFAANPLIANGTKSKQHVLNNVQAVPGTLIADSTGVQFGQQAGDTIGLDGGVEQDNSTVTVQGTLTVNGDYAENGGTLILQSASLTADSVDVAAGAVLSGYGAITANVTNAGEVDLPPYSSHTLAVSGSFTMSGGSVSIPSGDSLTVGGSYDQSGGALSAGYGSVVSVGGTADLSGGTMALTYGPTLSVASSLIVSGASLQASYAPSPPARRSKSAAAACNCPAPRSPPPPSRSIPAACSAAAARSTPT